MTEIWLNLYFSHKQRLYPNTKEMCENNLCPFFGSYIRHTGTVLIGAPYLRLFMEHLRRIECPFAPQSCTFFRPFQKRIFVKRQHIWTFYLNLSISSVCQSLSVVPCSPRGGGSRILSRICFFLNSNLI